MPPNVQYVIKRGLVDNMDYNKDGVIDEYDDFVFKYVDGVEVERKPLNTKIQKQLDKIMYPKTPQYQDEDEMQRVVYHRMPPQHMAHPPPFVVKDETRFGQHIKAGAGDMIGRVAVLGAVNVLAGVFGDD